MNNERILNQDIYYCHSSKIFDEKKYISFIERDIDDIIDINPKNNDCEISFDIHKYFDEYKVITFTDKIIKYLSLKNTKNNIKENNCIIVYKLEKGTKIPEGFDVVLDKFYHLKIFPTEPVKCKYHYICNKKPNLSYKHKCLTFDKITNLNWKLYGYIDKKEKGDFSSWFIEKHKDKIFKGYVSKCNYLDFIHSVDISKDCANCVDSLFFPYLTKIKEPENLFIYEFLKNLTFEYISYSDWIDYSADNEVLLLYKSIDDILN